MNRYKYIDEKKEHLHTLDGKPLIGTSTVTKEVLSKPIKWWVAGKAVELFGWKNKKMFSVAERQKHALGYLNKLKETDIEDYVSLLEQAYRNHDESLNEAAEKGTDMHAELEEYVRSCIDEVGVMGHSLKYTGENKKIKKFSGWCEENVSEFLWAEGNCYSEKMWTGGIADMGARMKDGDIALFDFKSAKSAYFDHFVQCGGYTLAVEENGIFDKDGNSQMKLDAPIKRLYIVPFGAEDPTPRVRYDVDCFRDAFKNTLELYKLMREFNS